MKQCSYRCVQMAFSIHGDVQARLHRLNSNDPKAHRDEVEQRCKDNQELNTTQKLVCVIVLLKNENELLSKYIKTSLQTVFLSYPHS